MEEVRSRPAADVVSEPKVAVDETGNVISTGAFTRQVEVTSVRHNLKQIKVWVTFPGGPAPVELLTLAYVGAL
jgi:hypothetical protein